MNKKQKKNLIKICISIILLIPSEIFKSKMPVVLSTASFLIIYIIIGYDVLKKALKGIFRRQIFDENFLMSLATIGALALGNYSEAVAVMLLYKIGEVFESMAVGKSRKSITKLMDIRPDYANAVIDGEIKRVSPDEVLPGTLIVVRPGEKIPIDGFIVEGEATLDTSSLTGESVPVDVKPGEQVTSASINLNGVLKIQTSKSFEESTVSKILEMVESASSRKSKTEGFIGRFAAVYTPIVCICAILLAGAVPIVRYIIGMEPDVGVYVYRALTFLVISCPCALVISIPLTFFAGIGGAGREGILVKGSEYLELLSKVNILAMDKTGTLTEGAFAVSEVVTSNGNTEETVLKMAALAEYYSNHPIAVGIKKAYEVRFGCLTEDECTNDIVEKIGYGIIAKRNNDNILVGSKRLLEENNIAVDEINDEASGTKVYVAYNNEYVGCIKINDRIKKGALDIAGKLSKNGVERVIMLTGDNELNAGYVAAETGIKEVYSNLLPGDKLGIIEKILDDNRNKSIVGFIGDGINDAPVLAGADIGIAMGGLGSDAAIEAADVCLMDDDPEKIIKAFFISRKCIRIVYENIFFTLGIKLICLILGACGIAGMWSAVFADVGVMVIAVFNAIRALKMPGIQ